MVKAALLLLSIFAIIVPVVYHYGGPQLQLLKYKGWESGEGVGHFGTGALRGFSAPPPTAHPKKSRWREDRKWKVERADALLRSEGDAKNTAFGTAGLINVAPGEVTARWATTNAHLRGKGNTYAPPPKKPKLIVAYSADPFADPGEDHPAFRLQKGLDAQNVRKQQLYQNYRRPPQRPWEPLKELPLRMVRIPHRFPAWEKIALHQPTHRRQPHRFMTRGRGHRFHRRGRPVLIIGRKGSLQALPSQPQKSFKPPLRSIPFRIIRHPIAEVGDYKPTVG